MMEERRRFIRLDTRLPVTYRVVSSPAPAQSPSAALEEATTKDVSGGGICLFLEKPLPVRTRLEVAINLPGQERPVMATGEIVWCEQYEMLGTSAQPPTVQAGVRFMQIDPQDQQRIMRHVILCFQPPPSA